MWFCINDMKSKDPITRNSCPCVLIEALYPQQGCIQKFRTGGGQTEIIKHFLGVYA